LDGKTDRGAQGKEDRIRHEKTENKRWKAFDSQSLNGFWPY
jgi:hypothetical protein